MGNKGRGARGTWGCWLKMSETEKEEENEWKMLLRKNDYA